MYRSAATVGTARIAPDIIVRMPSRALRVLRIVLSVRFGRPVVWLKVSQIERATPASRAAYQFLSEGTARFIRYRQGPLRHPVQRAYRRRRPDRLRPCLQDGARRYRVEAEGLALSFRPIASDWLKMKNSDAPAIKREAEEDWGKRR